MAISTRASQLEKLSMQLPQANQQLANQQQAARVAQLQDTISQAPQQVPQQAIGQLAAQQVAQGGQINLQAQAQTQTQQGQLAQSGLKQQQQQVQARQVQQEIQLDYLQQKTADNIASMDNRLKNEILDKELRFRRDNAGQTLFNQRQLADWAVLKSKNQQDYRNYEQFMRQTQSRKLYTMQHAYDVLANTLKNNQTADGKRLDRETKLRIVKAKRDMQAKIQRENNAAANRMAAWQAGGTIVGSAVGSYFGPAGAVAGGTIGSATGSVIARSTKW